MAFCDAAMASSECNISSHNAVTAFEAATAAFLQDAAASCVAAPPFCGSYFMTDHQKGITASQKSITETLKAGAVVQKAIPESKKGGSIHKTAASVTNKAIGNYKKHPE